MQIETKKNIKFLLGLTGINVGIWAFVSGLLMGLSGFVKPETMNVSDVIKSTVALFIICFFNSLLVLWYTKNSIYLGKKLFARVFLIVFGVMFFMTQIETIYFNYAIKMPWPILFITLFTGLLVGLVYSSAAVKLKKIRNKKPIFLYHLKKTEKIFIKFTLLSFVYTIFYFLFGYYIAWQFPLLREYYTGTSEILPFFKHIKNQLLNDSNLIFFQIFRGYLWAIMGYFIFNGINTKTALEKYILVAFSLSLNLALPLIVPNEYLPYSVRFGHFFELLTENFLFGLILTKVFETDFTNKK